MHVLNWQLLRGYKKNLKPNTIPKETVYITLYYKVDLSLEKIDKYIIILMFVLSLAFIYIIQNAIPSFMYDTVNIKTSGKRGHAYSMILWAAAAFTYYICIFLQ